MDNETPFALFMKKLTEHTKQSHLAKILDLSESEISSLVNGTRQPTQAVVRKFRERMPDYYPSAMLAVQQTLNIALPFELTNTTPNQEVFIYALSLLWDKDPGDDFYKLLSSLVENRLKQCLKES